MSNPINVFLFGILMACVCILIKVIGFFIQKGFTKEVIKEIDKINFIVEWFFWVFTFSIFMYFLRNYNHPGKLFLIIWGIIFGSLIISFGFIVSPILILLQKRKYTTSNYYQDWARETIDCCIQIRIIKLAHANAYATGIFASNKVILLSELLINNMQEEDIKNIIFHEYAHLRNNHLFILYLSNVLCCSISVISTSYFYPLFEKTANPGLCVTLHGAIFGILYIIIPGIVQRKLEYHADRFAAIAVGREAYSKSLLNLNTITNKGLEKVVVNYPNLNERLKHVSNF